MTVKQHQVSQCQVIKSKLCETTQLLQLSLGQVLQKVLQNASAFHHGRQSPELVEPGSEAKSIAKETLQINDIATVEGNQSEESNNKKTHPTQQPFTCSNSVDYVFEKPAENLNEQSWIVKTYTLLLRLATKTSAVGTIGGSLPADFYKLQHLELCKCVTKQNATQASQDWKTSDVVTTD